MMEVIPIIVDGAVVLNLDNSCMVKSNNCENCSRLVIQIYNWAKKIGLEYLIFDLQEEKSICSTFLVELMQIKKRLKYPFLFCGVMQQAKNILISYNCNQVYPFFATPEDAIRALRIQNPGLTEIRISSKVLFGRGIIESFKVEKELGEAKMKMLTI